MNENQEVKRTTSKSRLKALVKKGRMAAIQAARAKRETGDDPKIETGDDPKRKPSDDLKGGKRPETKLESVEHLDELIIPKRGKSGSYSGPIRAALRAGSERAADLARRNVLSGKFDGRVARANKRAADAEGPVTRFVNKLADKMRERSERRRTGKKGAGPRKRNPVNSSEEAKRLDAEADKRDRERAMMHDYQTKGNRGGHDPSDWADSYTPEGDDLQEKDYGKLIDLGIKRAKAKRVGQYYARQVTNPNIAKELKGRDAEGKTVVVRSSYEPEGETTLSEFDSSTTEFVDRVMNRVNEGFDKMTAGELEDYDNNANKPKHGREASQEERKEMAAKFRKSRGGASTKTKKKRDLRLRKAK